MSEYTTRQILDMIEANRSSVGLFGFVVGNRIRRS